uniref:Uncharacterized protein n=1 Tax=Timema bartmani TaxID=61472 RepID=A0A7R9I647_9NEOP|nr:unnamed protein product [Timema bartmani]
MTHLAVWLASVICLARNWYRLLMGMDLNDQHIQLFREKAIDMDTFLILTEEDLIEMEIEDPDSLDTTMKQEFILLFVFRFCFEELAKVPSPSVKVLDATKIMLSSTNHLDTLYNLLTYVQLRLRDQPVINQFLYDQYSASEGAEEMTKLLLQRVERLHDELQGLQDDINQFNTQHNNSCYYPYGKECEYGSSTLHIYTGVRQAILTIMDAMSRAEYAARSTMPTPNVIRNPTRTDHVRGEM